MGLKLESFWTGKPPVRGECPGVDADGALHALSQVATGAGRRAVRDYFDNGWTLTELLFSALRSDEAFHRPPAHGLRHPLIFYYAHPAVLYVNKLRLAGLLPAPVDAAFESLFETGVDEMSWDDMAKNEMVWPAVEAVRAYRAQVYRAVCGVIAEHPDLDGPTDDEHPLWALFMGFEHERIHIETSAVLIRELPAALVRRPAAWPEDAPLTATASADRDFFVALPAGDVRIGKSAASATFGWDNEYGERVASVSAGVEAAATLVANGEVLAFVRAGGYRDERWWSNAGWRWRTFRNASRPAFWVEAGPRGLHEYRLRAQFEVIDLPLEWPALVNFHEAEAYARWRTAEDGGDAEGFRFRLPSEAEQHAMRRLAATEAPNLALKYGSESPVGGAGAGIHDAFGNAWQWCADHFHPLPGFRVHKLYDDFSTPCFDGEHQMILGGSFLSAGAEASASARFHFRPHFLQTAAIRLMRAPAGDDGGAVDLRRPAQTAGAAVEPNPYERDQLLRDYLVLHFGEAADQMPYAFGPVAAVKFPQRCAALVLDAAAERGVELKRVLDVGCAVGGSTFALAEHCAELALGVDLSAQFIRTAGELKEHGAVRYAQVEEGALSVWRTAVVDSAKARGVAQFRRADACSLPPELVGFDAVLMANLLCRVPSPLSVLQRLAGPRGLVRPGGILALTTPFSWLPEYTPQDLWLGGYERDGVPVWSADELLRILAPDFELLRRGHIPLVIREHSRKFQYIVADSFVFQRR